MAERAGKYVRRRGAESDRVGALVEIVILRIYESAKKPLIISVCFFEDMAHFIMAAQRAILRKLRKNR